MPRPAEQLTREHRRAAGVITTSVERRVHTLAKRAGTADIDAWWKGNLAAILRIVVPGFTALAELTARYLRGHAAVEGVKLEPVAAVLDLDQLKTSLRVTGPVAFKKHMSISGSPEASRRVMANQLSRTAASRVLDADRETVMATFAEDDQMVGWRRVLNSPNPCAFCAMLASRGAVYTKESVGFMAHKPGCSCTALPLYEREKEPDEVVALRKLWEESTAGLSGKDALAAFRRAYDGQGVEAPPEKAPDVPDVEPEPEPEPAPEVEPERAFEAYPGNLSESAAEQWMAQRWGEDDVGKRAILLKGLGKKSANEVADTLNELFTSYPNTAKRIRVVGASAPVSRAIKSQGIYGLRNIGRAYADAARQIGSLRINGTKAKKTAELKAMLTSDVETGWHPTGTDSLAAVVRHEFGHFMFWQAQDSGVDGPGSVRDEVEEVARLLVEERRGPGSFDARIRNDYQRNNVSRYATTNRDELMAEAFAFVTSHDNPTRYARKLVDVLLKHAEGQG